MLYYITCFMSGYIFGSVLNNKVNNILNQKMYETVKRLIPIIARTIPQFVFKKMKDSVYRHTVTNISRTVFQVDFWFRNKEYAFFFYKSRTPNPKVQYYMDGENITESISKYAGPNEDFFMYPMTPKDIGYPEGLEARCDGKYYEIGGTEIIKHVLKIKSD